MRKHFLTLVCMLMAWLACGAYGQSPDLRTENRNMTRVVRHPDGSRSIYVRNKDTHGMVCCTYTASGKLAAVNEYHEGKFGQLTGCTIYSNERGRKEIVYKVAYGYDSSGRLIEERMYSHPHGKLVQRVIYKYDAGGNRSKPLIISLNPNAASSVAPTMSEDAARINRELNSGSRRRR